MTCTVSLRRIARRRGFRALLGALAMASVGVTASCDDPYQIDWSLAPDTAVLYALSLPDRNLPSGFDFYNRSRVVLEKADATGSWDMAVDVRGGKVVLLPPGALGVSSKAQVAALPGRTFADVIEAPSDTAAYTARSAVPVEMGTIYVWRSRQQYGAYGTTCVYYAKMEPLAIDVAGGTLQFLFDGSPVCNDRSLIPPK